MALRFSVVSVVMLATGAWGCMSTTGIIPGPGNLLSVADFLRITEQRNYNPQVVPGQLTSDRYLNCNFDYDNEVCNWMDGLGEVVWRMARFTEPLNSFMWQSIMGKTQTPDMYFLYAGEPSGRPPQHAAILKADVPCQSNTGQLVFDSWASSTAPLLEVCVIDINSGIVQFCQALDARKSNAQQVSIPASQNPFQVQIRISNFIQPDLVMIDNIRYTGSICQSGGGNGGVRTTTTNPFGETTEGPCNTIVGCDFNSGDSCFFSPTGLQAVNGMWNIGSGRTGNPHTGIKLNNPNDNGNFVGYAFVGRDDNLPGSPIYVLESPIFSVTEPTTLSFDYYTRTVKPVLEVCMNDINNCIWVNPPVDPKAFWRTAKVQLIPGEVNKLLFVVKDLTNFGYVAVDNIRYATNVNLQPTCDIQIVS